MAIYSFLVRNSRLLLWAFIGVMIFWGWNQAQERKLDAQRIQTLETTVTQMSNTVKQMAVTMQQTAELMQKFNQMSDRWNAERQSIGKQQAQDKARNDKEMQSTDFGDRRIPDSIINGLRNSAAAARNASDSAVSANAAKPDN